MANDIYSVVGAGTGTGTGTPTGTTDIARLLDVISQIISTGSQISGAVLDYNTANQQLNLQGTFRAQDLALARQYRSDQLRQTGISNRLNQQQLGISLGQLGVQKGNLELGQSQFAWNKGIQRETLNKTQIENWGAALSRVAANNAQFKNWLLSMRRA